MAAPFVQRLPHLRTAMPVYVIKNPERLSWANLTTVDNQPVDDGTPVDAITKFRYIIPNGFRYTGAAGGRYAMSFPARWQIVIRPRGQKWRNGNLTTALLAHEELHYFFGYITARAMVNELLALRVADPRELQAALNTAADTHLLQYAEALNEQYDIDTAHGTDATEQRRWKTAMDQCLLDPNATQLLGLSL
jgi:Bacterial protein of unknown function (DUF922)